MADVEFDEFGGSFGAPARPARVQRMVNLAGAAISVALIVGLTVWAYNLAVRDTRGIPVVRAMEGPMRIAPENPGGEIAAHQGLSVNAVAAVGTALPPPDTLMLAPRPVDLAMEDAPGLAEPSQVAAGADAGPGPEEGGLADTVETLPDTAIAPLETEADALALADALAAGATPLEAPAPLAEVDPAPPGAVIRSPRPAPRPASLAVAAAAPASAAPVAVPEVDPASLKAGTRLVQLGAFDDESAARAEWDRLNTRFSELLTGKSRVVQAAQSGGRTFFRLRAHGFDDEADARRFCSALLAENAACIPVAVR